MAKAKPTKPAKPSKTAKVAKAKTTSPRPPKKAAPPRGAKASALGKKVEGLDAGSLPTLSAFARAYLHQDLTAEYADAAGAAAAFCLDATPVECAALAHDLARLLAAAQDWPAPQLARYFTHDLGAAWAPSSSADLDTLAAVVRGMA
jgi:hypothetical protein